MQAYGKVMMMTFYCELVLLLPEHCCSFLGKVKVSYYYYTCMSLVILFHYLANY